MHVEDVWYTGRLFQWHKLREENILARVKSSGVGTGGGHRELAPPHKITCVWAAAPTTRNIPVVCVRGTGRETKTMYRQLEYFFEKAGHEGIRPKN